MQIIFYETHKKPQEINVTQEELSGLVGGVMDVEEIICGACVVWYKNLPIPKDRAKYHRNVCITKQVDGEIKSIITPIYSNFFLCGYNDGSLTDMPQNQKTEIMSMFGF